jgi:hypothetical protein
MRLQTLRPLQETDSENTGLNHAIDLPQVFDDAALRDRQAASTPQQGVRDQ